jgi:hypothetical protein
VAGIVDAGRKISTQNAAESPSSLGEFRNLLLALGGTGCYWEGGTADA